VATAEVLSGIANDLAGPGWSLRHDFFDPDLTRALHGEAEAAWRDGALRPAAIGRGEGRSVHEEIRGDSIRWVDSRSATPSQRALLGELEALRLALNRELQLGLWDVEIQLAAYPPGARYHRHLDQFAGLQLRRVTVMLYLNPGWTEELGGALRMYTERGVVHVLPAANTFLCFLSERIEHEVLPARQLRFSIGGWLRRREI